MRTFAPAAHNILSWVAPLLLGALLLIGNAFLHTPRESSTAVGPTSVHNEQPLDEQRSDVELPDDASRESEIQAPQEGIVPAGLPLEPLSPANSKSAVEGSAIGYRTNAVTKPMFTITPAMMSAARTTAV
ncbi:MAG: hypothetical protein R3272_16080 [Candidatus Promineifilaceae bacterium]|nr:hypothetical protein [Candidatus Promineifilaceae bacterium]